MKERDSIFNWQNISKYRSIIYGLAAFNILTYHYASIYSYFPDAHRPFLVQLYFDVIGSVGVEIFLFLSGISMYFSYSKVENNIQFIKKRLVRIFSVYFPIGMVFWGITDFLLTDYGSVQFLKDLFFISFWQNGEDRFWFVAIIVLLYLIVPLVYKLLFCDKTRKRVYPLVVIVGICLCFLIIFRFFFESEYQRVNIGVTRIPIFIVGMYFGKKVSEKIKFKITDLILLIVGFVAKTLSLFCTFDNLIVRIITSLFAISMCIVIPVIIHISYRILKFVWIIFQKLGKISLELYLTNVAIIKISIDYGIKVIDVKAYMLILLIGLIISLLLYYAVRMVKKFYSFLIKKNNYKWYCATLMFLIFLIKIFCNFPIKIITVPSDEFNTVSAAAEILGLPWGNVTTPSGYYGYTAILLFLPVFACSFLLKSGYILCQLVLSANVICGVIVSGLTYLTIYHLSNKKMEPVKIFGLVFFVSFIPQFFITGQMAQNEAIYCLAHSLVIFSIVLYFKTKKIWKKNLVSIVCAIGCIMAFAGNNRGVVIIIAVCVSLIIVRILYKRWLISPIFFSISCLSGLIVHKVLLYPLFRQYFPSDAYNTDAGLIFDRIPRILTNWEDMKACLVTGIGWLYSFIVSTYGMGLIALACMVYIIVQICRCNNVFNVLERFLCILLILWFIGTSMLCIINFLDSIQGIFQFRNDISYNPSRVDKIFYFRYYIGLVPFMLAYSIHIVIKYRLFVSKLFWAIVSVIFFTVILLFHGYIAVYLNGMSYAITSSNYLGFLLGQWTDNYKYGLLYSTKFVIATLIACVVVLAFGYCCIKHKLGFWYKSICVFSLVFCVLFSFLYMGPRSNYWKNLVDDSIVDFVEEYNIEYIYVEDNDVCFLYQFSLPFVEVSSTFNGQELLLTNSSFVLPDQYQDDYKRYLLDDEHQLYILDKLSIEYSE